MPINKILIVEDSPTELFFVSDLLTRNGYTVTSAKNGEEALAKIKESRPELILMDVIMPGQNGFQVTRAITKDPETSSIPIIMCTSKNQETDKIWALRQGAKDYVTKPVDADTLLRKIAALN